MRKKIYSFILVLAIFYSCAAKNSTIPVRELSVTEETGFAGLGIESKDIDKIAEKMVVDLLESDFYLQNNGAVPVIILEGEYFINESSYIINNNLLADRMRIKLVRETKERLKFVTRANLKLLIKEAETSGSDVDIIEADYRMTARIASIHSASNETGAKSNYFQFSFELLDLETSSIVWANIYDVKKIGADDTIYR